MAQSMDEELIVDLDEQTPAPGEIALMDAGDGGLIIDLEPQQPETRTLTGDNLAESLEEHELSSIAQKVIEWVDADEKSREPWLNAYKRGLERAAILGEGKEASMEGGATVTHPMIIQAAVQFQARAMAEMLPPSGPVKAVVLGETNDELDAQRERVEAHMNWQLTEEDEEYYEDRDRMYFNLPLMGCAFTKTHIDEELGYVTSPFISANDIVMPYNAKSWRHSPRITHIIRYNAASMQRLQNIGTYLSQDKARLTRPDVDATGGEQPISSEADKRLPSDQEEDAEYTVFECHCEFQLSTDEEPLPYVISVEKTDARVLAIRKNCEENNERSSVKRQQWFTQYNYLPGLGVYGFSLFHAIGTLADAATDTLRALLDNAAAANWQGGFVSMDSKLPGKQIRMKHGVWQQVEMTAEELNKSFYTPPFRDATASMYQLLGFLQDAGATFMSITEQMAGEANSSMPVGTIVALIEQGDKVYSGIHKRSHKSARHEFRLRAKLNHEFLEETGKKYSTLGKNLLIRKSDYDRRIDVVPVSDPNISSTPQRLAIAQAVVSRADAKPGLYNQEEAEKRLLQALRVPELEKLLIERKEPVPLDVVTEGAMLLQGQPVKAFPDQNHDAHMAVHMGLIEQMKGNALLGAQVIPLVVSHIAEHTAQKYRLQMMQAIQIPLPPLEEVGGMQGVPPEIDAEIADAAAMAAQEMSQVLANPEAAAAAIEVQVAQLNVAEKEQDVAIKGVELQIKEIERDQKAMELDAAAYGDQTEAAVEQREAEVLEAAQAEIDRIQGEADQKVAQADEKVKKADTTLVVEKMRQQTRERIAAGRNETTERVATRKAAAKSPARKPAAKGMKDGGVVEAEAPASAAPVVIVKTGGGSRSFNITGIKRDKDGNIVGARGTIDEKE